MAKEWTIPTVLRELRRVYMDATDGEDIMNSPVPVAKVISGLTEYHMQLEMGVEIPGQTVIPIEDKKVKASEK